jgi:hypothetical protein
MLFIYGFLKKKVEPGAIPLGDEGTVAGLLTLDGLTLGVALERVECFRERGAPGAAIMGAGDGVAGRLRSTEELWVSQPRWSNAI